MAKFRIVKLYVVYFRTMVDSPEVEIRCATTNKALADAKFKEAKREEEEWMADEEEGSGNWAEACMTESIISDDFRTGDQLFIRVETEWYEAVTTEVHVHGSPFWAEKGIAFRKRKLLEDDPNLVPYDEDETFEESMHLRNPDVMSDYYFSVEPVTIQ